jgi:hypothetical protein
MRLRGWHEGGGDFGEDVDHLPVDRIADIVNTNRSIPDLASLRDHPEEVTDGQAEGLEADEGALPEVEPEDLYEALSEPLSESQAQALLQAQVAGLQEAEAEAWQGAQAVPPGAKAAASLDVQGAAVLGGLPQARLEAEADAEAEAEADAEAEAEAEAEAWAEAEAAAEAEAWAEAEVEAQAKAGAGPKDEAAILSQSQSGVLQEARPAGPSDARGQRAALAQRPDRMRKTYTFFVVLLVMIRQYDSVRRWARRRHA